MPDSADNRSSFCFDCGERVCGLETDLYSFVLLSLSPYSRCVYLK